MINLKRQQTTRLPKRGTQFGKMAKYHEKQSQTEPRQIKKNSNFKNRKMNKTDPRWTLRQNNHQKETLNDTRDCSCFMSLLVWWMWGMPWGLFYHNPPIPSLCSDLYFKMCFVEKLIWNILWNINWCNCKCHNDSQSLLLLYISLAILSHTATNFIIQ